MPKPNCTKDEEEWTEDKSVNERTDIEVHAQQKHREKSYRGILISNTIIDIMRQSRRK